jgi:plastocyanin
MRRTVFTRRTGRWWVAPLLALLGGALAVAAACNGDNGDSEAPAAVQTPAADEDTAEIKMIPTIRFDKSELTIAADTNVTITVENADDGVRHNFAVYESEDDALGGEDPIAETEICTAPCVDTVTLNLSAGEYFFRCEVHPSQMTGTLIAE